MRAIKVDGALTMMHVGRMDRGFCVLQETNCVFN